MRTSAAVPARTPKTRLYSFDDLAGCVTRQHSRLTGHLYGLYQGEQAGFDTYAGLWQTVCEDHGTICSHETLKLARLHLPNGEWCEACQAELERKTGARPDTAPGGSHVR